MQKKFYFEIKVICAVKFQSNLLHSQQWSAKRHNYTWTVLISQLFPKKTIPLKQFRSDNFRLFSKLDNFKNKTYFFSILKMWQLLKRWCIIYYNIKEANNFMLRCWWSNHLHRVYLDRRLSFFELQIINFFGLDCLKWEKNHLNEHFKFLKVDPSK